MTITIYELLGLVKDGKAPKRIKVTGNVYDFDEECNFYFTKTKNGRVALGGMLNEINLLFNSLNGDNVEILEENKIEKEELFTIDNSMTKASLVAWQKANNGIFKKKIDQLIDEINKLKEDK